MPGEALTVANSEKPLQAILKRLLAVRPDAGIDIGDCEHGWQTARDVHGDDIRLEEMLFAQAAANDGLDRKGQAAYLVNAYGMAVSTVLIAPLIAGGLSPDITSGTLALRLAKTDKGLALHLRLLSSCFASADAHFRNTGECLLLADHDSLLAHLRQGITAFFQPLIASLHRLTGLPPQAMWRLVGDAVAAVFLQTGRYFGCEQAARRDALFILKAEESPLFNPQLYFFDIVIHDPLDAGRIVAARSYRSRGGCCRYYTTGPGRLCSTCVLAEPGARDARLRTALAKAAGVAAPKSAPVSGF